VTHSQSNAGNMLRLGLVLLVTTALFGSFAYHYVEGWSLFNSAYMVIITLSTVGYREVAPLSDPGKLITGGLIVFGLASVTLIGASLTRLILEGEIQQLFGKRRMERVINNLYKHYIVCGYGRVGRVVCRELDEAEVPFVVLDADEEMVERIEADGFLAWRGDATEEAAMKAVHIETAKGVILALPHEADNVYVTLLVKDLHPDLFVLARAITDNGDRRLKAAGADRVVSPNIIGGQRMAHSVLRPKIVEFIDVVSGSTGIAELALQEVQVPEASPLAGKTIAEAELRRRYCLLIVGRMRVDGSVAINPLPTDTIRAGSMLIVLGRREDLDRFADELSLR